MYFFQLSMPYVRFLLLPHAAFSDTAPFDAIIALTGGRETAPEKSCGIDEAQMSRGNR